MPDRRNFIRTAVAGTAVAAGIGGLTDLGGLGGLGGTAAAAPAAAAPARSRTATFTWFGTSGWRIDVGGHTLLVDPYLSRYDTGLFAGAFNPATPLTIDAEAIAARVGTPQAVLVTHTHWDHFNDVPHIATTTGTRVVGTLTAYHLALAGGVPAAQLSPVKGGEVLDFGEYTVEVVASLHSRNAAYSLAFPGVRVTQPPRPATIADLPEGDTLAYQVTVKDGARVFFMGGSDFVERNLAGLDPDVAMIALQSSTATADYVPRLMEALGRPRTVVPVHWDNFETPLVNPPRIAANDRSRLDTMIAAIRKVSPRTQVVTPSYDTPYTF